jgi:hypothetical protein
MREYKTQGLNFYADTRHNIKNLIYIDAIFIMYYLLTYYKCKIYFFLIIYTCDDSDVFTVSLI